MAPKRVRAGESHLTGTDARAQASAMMMRRLFDGASLKKLGEEFDLDPRTVERRLVLARKDGVPDEAREIFIREMLPASLVRLQEALAGEDLRLAVMVALKVVDGLKAMELVSATGAGSIEETLEAWRIRKVTRRVDEPTDPAPGPLPASPDVVEGVLVKSPRPPLPPTSLAPPSPGAGPDATGVGSGR